MRAGNAATSPPYGLDASLVHDGVSSTAQYYGFVVARCTASHVTEAYMVHGKMGTARTNLADCMLNHRTDDGERRRAVVIASDPGPPEVDQ